MKYDIYCAGMWWLLQNSFVSVLTNHIGKENAKNAMIAAKTEYRDILERTEGIGGVKSNPLTINFINGAMMIAVHMSVLGWLSEEQIGDIYIEAMRQCFVVKMKYKENIFTEKWQNKQSAAYERSKKNGYKNDWVGELVKGKKIDEFSFNYSACGICKLCQQEGCAGLAKQMCRFDYVSAEMRGAELKRTKTIADGDGMCDFWFVKKP